MMREVWRVSFSFVFESSHEETRMKRQRQVLVFPSLLSILWMFWTRSIDFKPLINTALVVYTEAGKTCNRMSL